MAEHPISDLVSSALQSIREMVDVNTIVGTPIETADGTTIIPVSRVTFGFVSGGSEFGAKKDSAPNAPFGGGSGAGVSINPVGFLTVCAGEVKLIPIANEGASAIEKVIEAVPGAVERLSDFLKKRKDEKQRRAEED